MIHIAILPHDGILHHLDMITLTLVLINTTNMNDTHLHHLTNITIIVGLENMGILPEKDLAK